MVSLHDVADRDSAFQPGGVRNFNFSPGTGCVSFVSYSVLCCLWRWPSHSADHSFQGGSSLMYLCNILVQNLSSPTGICSTGIWVVIPGEYKFYIRGELIPNEKKEYTCDRFLYFHISPAVSVLVPLPLEGRTLCCVMRASKIFFWLGIANDCLSYIQQVTNFVGNT